MKRKLALLITERYAINSNDFYMFYTRTEHDLSVVVHHENVPRISWWRANNHWWRRYKNAARAHVYDRMKLSKLKLIPWKTNQELADISRNLDCDYLCLGNGSGDDQHAAIEAFGRDRCLFSEYGWIPWNESFYISRGGCGMRSEIAQVNETDLTRQSIRTAELEEVKARLTPGAPVPHEDFIYVPLQKDVDDFKFNFTSFGSNREFLDFIHEIAPPGMKVLVKEHPLYRKNYDLSMYGRFIDISDANYSKAELYRKMRAMICINSTSILEALMFEGRVFAYGEDLFLNKGLVNFSIRDKAEFNRLIEKTVNTAGCHQFISLLLERQINRFRCIRNDRDYIENHYWNKNI